MVFYFKNSPCSVNINYLMPKWHSSLLTYVNKEQCGNPFSGHCSVSFAHPAFIPNIHSSESPVLFR